MKKSLHILFAAMAISALSATAQQSAQFTCDNLNYRVTDSVARTVEVASPATQDELTSVVIPAMVTDGGIEWRVTAIGNGAFYLSELQSATLPNGLTRIGDAAFRYSALQQVNLPESLTAIGSGAFGETYLTDTLVIPDRVTVIGSRAFTYTDITKLQLGQSVREIGSEAFADCFWLTDVGDLPPSLTSIGAGAFASCALSRITIPGNVQYIGNNAFYKSDLQAAELSEGISTIGEGAFAFTPLRAVTLPASTRYVGTGAFVGTPYLEAIDVAPGNACYTSIGGMLLTSGCGTLVCCPGALAGELRLPDGVVTVTDNAFYYCTKLTTVVLSESVKQVGRHVFEGCVTLDSIYVPQGIEVWKSDITDIAWYKRQPNGVVYLGPVAFSKGFSDSYLRIKHGTRCIADGGFWNGNLRQVVLPKGLVYIGRAAFNRMNLKTLRLPATVKYIGSGAFSNNSSLSIINIPADVEAVEGGILNSCLKLSHLISYSPVPPGPRDWYNYMVSYVDTKCTLHCPQGSVDAYNQGGYKNAFNIEEIGPIGDVNNDFVADIDDLNRLINIILKRIRKPYENGLTFFLHDLNGDYRIDIEDVNEMVNILMGKSNP
ncbi:MAG: leucine-rich repeat protein [Muribaculaceae bacterium]|nr:leucine-rich repeat protein [Muribaculaceae bacterium]